MRVLEIIQLIFLQQCQAKVIVQFMGRLTGKLTILILTQLVHNNASGARTTGKLIIQAMRMRFDSSTPAFKDPHFCSVAIFGDQ